MLKLKQRLAIASIMVVVVTLIWYLLPKSGIPSIDDIWVINLDDATTRLQRILEQQQSLPKPIQRWAATYGREVDRESAELDGVDPIITKSSDREMMKHTTKVTRVGGEVGCWLSHKRLLKHLSTMKVGPNFGHLICEDDVIIPTDFIAKWNTIRHSISSDWDVVYLGAGRRHGDRINPSLLRWKSGIELSNLGTYAYLVRHRALPKLLEKTKHMFAPIDVQYSRTFGDLKVYIVDPVLIEADLDVISTTDRH